jgi:hypothetical protein
MDKEQTQRDLLLDFKKLESSLKEQSDKTFVAEGYNKLNQLQRVLLELVKEQIGYENTNSTTSKTR